MASPQGWTFVVGRNLLRRGHRRRRRELDVATTSGATVDQLADPDLWRAVAALPRRQREVVVLRYVADWPEREVADALGISPGTVGRTLHDARARLARTLGGAP
jgi:RNA polymerase sigma factor (sigma-70 family)